MKDILSRLHRIENLSAIKTELLSNSSGITFPREKRSVTSSNNTVFYELTNEKISIIMNKSLNDVKQVT